MGNDILTVEQAAGILELHPKTVRRFIREGRLSAGKAGGSWRILKEDLDNFIGKKPVKESFEKADDGTIAKIQVSAVVDLKAAGKEEAQRISNTLIAVMNGKGPEYGKSRMDFIYNQEEKTVRILLWGGAMFISQLLVCIEKLSE